MRRHLSLTTFLQVLALVTFQSRCLSNGTRRSNHDKGETMNDKDEEKHENEQNSMIDLEVTGEQADFP